MARHRLFNWKRSGLPYRTVNPRGAITVHASVWIVPSGGLTTIPLLTDFLPGPIVDGPPL